MKKRRFYLIISALLLAVSIAGFFAFQNKRAQTPELSSDSELSSAGWEGFDWENVDLRGREKIAYSNKLVFEEMKLDRESAVYSFRKGKVFKNGEELTEDGAGEEYRRVIRLAYFFEISRIDPLFYASELDVEKFSKAVDALENVQSEYGKKLNDSEARFYPLEFLRSFFRASSAFDNFKTDISEKNAIELLKKTDEAADAYKKDSETIRKKITPLAGETRKIAYLTGGAVTNVETILSDFSTMEENYRFVKKEISERKRCLSEAGSFCKYLPSVSDEKENKSSQSKKPKLLSLSLINADKAESLAGPFAVKSKCWGADKTNYFYVANECSEDSNLCFERPFLATKSYFIQLNPGFIPYQKMYDAGIRAIPQSATSPYNCNDLSYQPTLATVADFYQKFKGAEITELSSVEEDFFEAEYPSDELLKMLGTAYFNAYTDSFADDRSEDNSRNELLSRYLIIRQKMSDFDLLTNRAAHHFINFTDVSVKSETKISDIYVYPIRTHYSLLFLNFSPNIWRGENHPRYLLEGEILKSEIDRGIIDFKTAVEKYGEKDLLLWQEQSRWLRSDF